MSTRKQTSSSQPASPSEPLLPEDQVLLAQDEFWENHKAKILTGAVTLLICALAAVAFLSWKARTRSEAAEALATASTPDQLQAVIERYRNTPAGLNAALLLAASLRDQGKIAESTALYESILSQANNDYPLQPEAALGLGQNALAAMPQGPPTASVSQTLREVATRFPRSTAAAMALLSEAQLAENAGQIENATRIFRDVMADFPNSLPAQVASQELQRLSERQPQPPAPSPESAQPPTPAATPQPENSSPTETSPAPAQPPQPAPTGDF